MNACLRRGYCPRLFRESTTVVIRKPGKPGYTTSETYRPITLLCTLGKALESVIATRLSFLVEEHRLLPEPHIGGRVGRSCDHALDLLLERVYESWRQDDRVASLLTLDVSGAFGNVSHKRLAHCLRMHKIPSDIFLSDRYTTLRNIVAWTMRNVECIPSNAMLDIEFPFSRLPRSQTVCSLPCYCVPLYGLCTCLIAVPQARQRPIQLFHLNLQAPAVLSPLQMR